MVKRIVKGAADGLFSLISAVLLVVLWVFALIKVFKWEFGIAFSLIFGGFLVGLWVGMYHKPDWMYGVGLLFIIVGLTFLFVLSNMYREK